MPGGRGVADGLAAVISAKPCQKSYASRNALYDTLLSVKRICLESVAYEYGFGPPNNTSLAIDAAEYHAIMEQMKHGGDAGKDATAKLEQLLARESQGHGKCDLRPRATRSA
jgi:hypothetical protein